MSNLTGMEVWTIYVSYVPSASKKHCSETEGMEEKRCVKRGEGGFSIRVHLMGCSS